MSPLTRRRQRTEASWPRVLACRCLLAIALLALPARAFTQDQQAIFELVVNGVTHGDTLVLLRGDDVLIGTSNLSNTGLQTFSGRREQVAGQEFVSLRSLAPALTFAVDERELRLRIDAATQLLPARVRDLRGLPPRDLTYRSDRSAFVNYGVGWSGGGDFDIAAESGARIGGALLHSTLSGDRQGFTRGLTSVTVDERSSLRRWVFGDSFARTDALGGSVFIAGITVSKEFGVDPYFVGHPRLSVATPVTTPSVVEVYVNDRLVSQQQVAPGQLDLQNLPLTRGRNDARVVVRDAFGDSREFSTGYYLSTTALARGLHSYQYSFGSIRDAVGSESWRYTSPALLARHRYGLTDVMTVGARVEATAGLLGGGPSLNLRLPVGELEGAVGISNSVAGTGAASTVSWVYSGRPISGGASLSRFGDRYTTVHTGSEDLRPLRQLTLFASAPVAPRVNLTVQHNNETLRDATSQGRTGLLASARLNQHADLTISAARVRSAQGRSSELYAGVTIPFGRSSATTSVVHDAAGSRSGVEVMRSLPVGLGYGYQLRAEGGSRNMVSGVAQLQGRYGRYELRREVLAGDDSIRVHAAGALVGIGGGIFATRPVRNSFALVQVPGVSGVRGFVSNQEVGQTDRNGNLLIPELEAYYGNILQIADEDIPLDYSVRGTRMALAPPFRGGALATFSVSQTRRISGTILIVDASGERVPSHGLLTVTVNNEAIASPVGSAGEFYFENLPEGTFDAVVEDALGSCSLAMVVRRYEAAALNLGTLRCTSTP